jgi:hypothetical protein
MQQVLPKDRYHYERYSLEEEISWYDKAWATVKNLGNAQLAAADVTITLLVGNKSFRRPTK